MAGVELEDEVKGNDTITAVPGIVAGHWTDLDAATGCTAVLCPEGAVVGVDVRGGSPGTRETDLARPTANAPGVHGVMLCGGSAFGLACADGAMRWLEERGRGFDVGVAVVPLVPAAVIFDLAVGSADRRPDAEAGYAACAAASGGTLARGCVGAGTGAAVGHACGTPMATKSGLGSAVLRVPDGPTVGAAAVVNAFGDVRDPQTGEIVAGARAEGGGFADTAARIRDGELRDVAGEFARDESASRGVPHTVIGVVATDARLSKAQVARLATCAHDGLARTIRPAHTMLDGDTVFALATGRLGATQDGSGAKRGDAGGPHAVDGCADVSALSALAADVFAAAILDSVRSASSLAGLPSAHHWTGRTRGR